MNGAGVGTIIGLNPTTGCGLIRARLTNEAQRPEWVSFQLRLDNQDQARSKFSLMSHIGLEVGFEYMPYDSVSNRGNAKTIFLSDVSGVVLYGCADDGEAQYEFPFLAMNSTINLPTEQGDPWNDKPLSYLLRRLDRGGEFSLISADSASLLYPFTGRQFRRVDRFARVLRRLRYDFDEFYPFDLPFYPLPNTPDILNFEILFSTERDVVSYGDLMTLSESSLATAFHELRQNRGRLVFLSRSLMHTRILAWSVASLLTVDNI